MRTKIAVFVVGLAGAAAVSLGAPSQTGRLDAGDRAATSRYFGTAAALDGDRAWVADSAGFVFAFARDAGTRGWTRTQVIDRDGLGYAPAFQLGHGLAVEGDTTLVGAPRIDLSGGDGEVLVYRHDGDRWTLDPQRLTPGDTIRQRGFGAEVALEGDVAVVGSGTIGFPPECGAWVFTRTGGVWGAPRKLAFDDATADDFVGVSVAISGGRIAVGGAKRTAFGKYTGSVHFFEQVGADWVQSQPRATASDAFDNDNFGRSVALSGDTALVGTLGHPASGSVPGAFYVFTHDGSSWTQSKRVAPPDPVADGAFGYSVRLEGDVALIGAPGDDDRGAGSGSAYVYKRGATGWALVRKLVASDGADYDSFGGAVALDEGSALVGAAGVGGDLTGDFGAAYSFDGLPSGVNHPPAFALPVLTSRSTAVEGQPVTLRTLAADRDPGDRVTYEWHFGDGTTATGRASIRHAYGSSGTFDAFARALDSRGAATDSPTTRVAVVPPKSPYFDIGTLVASLRFDRSGADAITISGQFPLADGTAIDGSGLTIDVAGEIVSLTVNAKGVGTTGGASVRVSPPRGGVARFKVKLTGSFAEAFDALGLRNASVRNVAAAVRVAITFDGVAYAEDFVVVYTGKAGKTGTAK